MSGAQRPVASRAYLALAVGAALAGPARGAEPVAAAVEYVERPEDGPLNANGRRLTTGGQALYGLDINSAVDLRIDADKLQAALLAKEAAALGPRAERLQDRMKSLGLAVKNVDAAARKLQQLIAQWRPGVPELDRAMGESARERFAIFAPLGAAMRQRAAETGGDRAAVDAALDATVSGPGLVDGYNWPLVGRLLNQELAAAEADLKALAAQRAYGIEIRSHLVSKNGQGTPIQLPGYNEAIAGPAKAFEKLQFSATGQADDYKRYEELAKQVGDSKNLGDGIVKQLHAEFEPLRAQFETLTQAARDARDRLRDRLGSLEKWGSDDERKAWLAKAEKDLGASAEGRRVADAWKALSDTTLAEIRDDIAALRSYADLRGQLAGRSAPEAMDALLKTLQALSKPEITGLRLFRAETWDARLAKIAEFTKAVESLKGPAKDRLAAADSPYGDLKAAHEAFTAFAAALRQGTGTVTAWIAKVLASGPAHAAADLALPPGHRRVPVRGSADLSTRFELQRVPVAREVGDTVRLQYDIFQGETRLANWSDEFSLRSYGWNAEVLASLALARQGSGATTWKAAPAMNWIASHTSWPGAGQSGLGRTNLNWFSGFGVSMMPLDSGSSEGVKLGIAATLAFINNRLLVGVGSNLQATADKKFVFFSIRLLDFPSLSGPLGGSAGQK